MKVEIFKKNKENDYISGKEMIDIFQMQYNDIFHNILKYDKNKMMMLLQEQVYIYLRVINKITDFSLIQHTFSLFLDKYTEDKEKVDNIYQIIKNYSSQIIYLDYLNCFIHCIKCKNALHKCGHNFIVYNDYAFCLSCKEVYNEFQVHMYCKECKKEYYTKLREIKRENEAEYFPVSFEKYHCPMIGFEEKIVCTKCKRDLYVDINSDKNKNKINQIFCKNCKYYYDINKMTYTCLNCKNNFKSEAKIYNYFPSSKVDLLSIIHCIFKKKYALPLIIANKQCRCDLTNIEMIKHNDGGNLLEGERLDEKIFVCNKCFGIFNLDSFNWACPKCKRGFGIKKFNVKEYNENNKYKKLNNYIYNSPNSKNNNKTNEKYHKIYYSSNNSLKKNNNKIKKSNYINKNITDNNKSFYKSSKSISYIKEIENKLRTQSKNSQKINMDEKFNTRNDIRNEFNKKNKEFNSDIYSQKKINANHIIAFSGKNSSRGHQRININLERIKNEDKTMSKINLYNNCNFNKSKNKVKMGDIKKKLFFESNENENKIIRKNYSVTNSLVIINQKENELLNAKNLFEEKSKQVKQNNKNFIKTISNMNHKKNHFNKINNIAIINQRNNKIKINNKKLIKNNEYKNISINIKLDNSDNNIINFNSSYINSTKNNNNQEINKTEINQNTQNDKKLKKNNINNLNNNKRKNHIHIISNTNINNSEISSKKNIKKSNIMQIMINNKNTSNNKINHINTFENIIQRKNILSPKNNLLAHKFHSNDYNIIDLIGEGTYGKIYLVKKAKTNEIFALKQISVRHKDDSNKYKKQFEFLMKLTENDSNLNVIKILGIEVKQLDKFNTVLYILMEAGKSDWEKELYKRNLSQNYYTEEELIDIVTSLVRTFAILQGKGISHRDVKPQNIVFFEKNKERSKNIYKITDFGEAKIRKSKNSDILDNFEKNTSKQTVRGTELYMSPLLFNALRNTGEIDIQYNPYKSDVYSLGLCILLAACLSYIPLYQIREINTFDKVKYIIDGYLKKRYSKKFINLILVMLQIDEKFRPDFIELNSWINNHYFSK